MTRLKYMPNHWGMHGFNRDPSLRKVHNSINVSQLDQMIDEGDKIDLTPMGFDKLLGSGKVSRAIHITVEHASSRAIEKIEAAGGTVSISDGDELEESEED